MLKKTTSISPTDPAQAERLHRRLRFLISAGLLLASFLIAVITSLIVYRLHLARLESEARFNVELKADALEAELSRLMNIAGQITSRTWVRQQLKKYYHGEIDRESLATISRPILADAMRLAPEVVSISRLSVNGELLVEVGDPIPTAYWPDNIHMDSIQFGTPLEKNNRFYLVLSAPIHNRKGVRVGIDLVAFNCQKLSEVMKSFFAQYPGVGIIDLASFNARGMNSFFRSTETGGLQDSRAIDTTRPEILLAKKRDLYVTADNGEAYVIVHRKIINSDWFLVFSAAAGEFRNPARSHAVTVGLTIFILALSASGLILMVIRPVSARMMHYTNALFQMSQENNDLLEKVQESQVHLKAILDNTPAVIYLKDPDGKYFLINREFEQLFDLSRDEIIGTTDYDIFPKETADAFTTNDRLVLQRKIPLELDEQAPHGDGFRDYLSVKFPIYTTDGALLGTGGISTDITARKSVEKALQKSEEHLRFVTDNSPVCIAHCDCEQRYKFVNSYYSEMLGIAAQDMIGRSVRQVIGEEAYAHAIPYLNAVFAGNHTEFDLVLPATSFRETLSVHIKYAPEVDASGQIVGFLTTILDVTQRKLAEAQIARFSHVIECSLNEIYIVDSETLKYIDVNEGARANLGYGIVELRSMTPLDLKPEFSAASLCKLLEPLRSGAESKITFDAFHRRKDGSMYPVEVHLQLVGDEPSVFVAFVLDITERTRAEAEKADLEKQIRRSQKLQTIGTLAGGIAHDFNNILMPILANADVALSRLPSTHPLTKYFDRILTGGNRAKELVEQISLFGKPHETNRRSVHLQSLIDEAVKLLRSTIPATVEIRQIIDDSCGYVLASESQIHQVIVNLCTNASQAMTNNGGTLTIELREVSLDAETIGVFPNLKEGKYIRLSVNDTGDGIDESIIDHIFEPFFTTRSVDGGSGMGLSVVHGIISSHHGDVHVDSQPGQGTTILVYLPAVEFANSPTGVEQKQNVRGQESIMIVDDDKNIAAITAEMLSFFGYNVDTYTCTNEALDAFRRQPSRYDLVISDLTMPGMTGLDLSDQIQKIRPGTPIIIMTGFANRLNDQTLEKHRICKVLGKPIVGEELAAAVREVIDA